MNEYSLVFAFNERMDVALIRKNRPDWQAGLWNGIGGRKEKNESYIQCAAREFFEETGVKLDPISFKWVGRVHGNDFSMHVYTVKDLSINNVKTTTDEEVRLFTYPYLNQIQLIDNIMLQIEMCKMWHVMSNANKFVPKFDLSYKLIT